LYAHMHKQQQQQQKETGMKWALPFPEEIYKT
jgi:hypothetical protein